MLSNISTQFPAHLKKGDLVRVISFGLSIKGISANQHEICKENFEKLGLHVSFAKHVQDSDEFDTSSVKARVEDLNEALKDPEVKLITSGLGGMSTAQILNSVNWSLLEENPKVFCGFSDMVVLVNAIYAKTGIATYYGPFYGTFGMKKGIEYMLDGFQKCLFSDTPFAVTQASSWSDDCWWIDQENRKFTPNQKPLIITKGDAEGILIGGHLASLSTLFGTEFFPNLSDSIVMVEDNSEINARSFDRLLQSLIQQKGFKNVKAILIGRFTSAAKISDDILVKIVKNHPELSNIPVIANLSFGHTYPQFTFPIGGTGSIKTADDEVIFNIIHH